MTEQGEQGSSRSEQTAAGARNPKAGAQPAGGSSPAGLLTVDQELDAAEAKAWDALGRYKFVMFGYWAGVWVHLNRLLPRRRPNPWVSLVRAARAEVAR